MASDTEIVIFIFVEPVTGLTTCPSNPSFEFLIDIGEPIGDRPLFDGLTVPATLRFDAAS